MSCINYKQRLSSLWRKGETMFINPEEVHFETLANGFLKLTLGDKTYDKVTLTRLLPYSYEEAYITVISAKEEVGMIKDLTALEKSQYDQAMAHLNYKYYIPEITKIKNVKEKMGFLYIDLDTTGGHKEICIADFVSNIRLIKDSLLSITDVEGNKYCMRNIEALDKESRQKLDVFL